MVSILWELFNGWGVCSRSFSHCEASKIEESNNDESNNDETNEDEAIDNEANYKDSHE